MAKVVIIGPAHPLRGGLATFNQRLAREFMAQGDECSIWSFSLQYPSFLFPGKTQYSDEPAPADIPIHTEINSINPFNWLRVGNKLRRMRPDLIIVRYWLPLMGPCLGTILRRVRKKGHTRIVCIADNIIPHEKRPGDKPFTRYFVKSCHAFITMSEKVMQDLRSFEDKKPALLIRHPLYDNFGEPVAKTAARQHLAIDSQQKLVIFFGFIRKYKGLDLLLQAMTDPRIRQAGIRLLVAGEFYEEEQPYRQQIEQSGISDLLILHTDFIPDSEVRYYLCAADAVIQPYRNATQSGVTPLAYHFDKPMVVTNVGGLPDLVPHEKAGLVVAPDPTAIADGILRFYQLGEDYFIPHLRTEKLKYSWLNVVNAARKLAADGNNQS
ncbi:MAG: glycosyltransferase [Chitinophagaceae bacterium]